MTALSYSLWVVQVPDGPDRRIRHYGAVPTVLAEALDAMSARPARPSAEEIIREIHGLTGMYPIGHAAGNGSPSTQRKER